MTGIESLSDLMDRVRRFTDQTSVDLYDLLPIEDREAIELVREHGGLESVKSLLGWVVSHCSTSQQLDFDFWLSGRVMHELGFEEDVADRDEVERRLLARLMPEGMGNAWWANGCGPMEDPEIDPSKRVKRPERKDSRLDGCCHPGSYKCSELAFYDQDRGKCVFADKCLVPELRKLRDSGIRTIASCCGHGTMRPSIVVAPECENEMRQQGYEGRRNKFSVLEFTAKSECPAHKALDADGVEIRVGDSVWDNRNWDALIVHSIGDEGNTVACRYVDVDDDAIPVHGMWMPSTLTHRAPVLAADGKPLREGETVYLTDSPTAFVVDDIMTREDGATVVHLKDGAWNLPQYLTHERPESWERLEEDAKKGSCDYFGCDADGCHGCPAYDWNTARGGNGCGNAKMLDLVRRAKALAERGA